MIYITILLLVLGIFIHLAVTVYEQGKYSCEDNDALIEEGSDVCVTSEGVFYPAILDKNIEGLLITLMLGLMATSFLYVLSYYYIFWESEYY